MNLQRQQTSPHPIRINIMRKPLQMSNPQMPVSSQTVYLSQQGRQQNFAHINNIATPLAKNLQCVSAFSLSQPSQPDPTIVRQPLKVLNSFNNVIAAPLLAKNFGSSLSQTISPASLNHKISRQPVMTVVRQPLNDRNLNSFQNVPAPARKVSNQHSIPKQHPLDKDLHQAKIISESVKSSSHQFLEQSTNENDFSDDEFILRKKTAISIEENTLKRKPDKDLYQKSTCHQFCAEPSFNNEDDEFSEDEFMPRKDKGTAIITEKKTVTRKIPVCRLKIEEVKALVTQAENISITNDDFTKVHDVLPSCFSYVVTECTSLENGTWKATIRAAIGSRPEAETWLTAFEKENLVDFRFQKSVSTENKAQLEFKRQYRCHHNTKPKQNVASKGQKSKNFRSKNTNCPAFVRITIKEKTMGWSSDYLLQIYPCEIVISYTHNHPIICANALRRRRPSQATSDKFTDLLKKGYSPLAALECHKFDLQTEHGDDYYKISADQSLCPSNFWVYKLYKKLCIKNYGPQTGDEMIDALKKFCEEYNNECQSECAKVVTTEAGQLIIAICTPLMKRASVLLKGAGEMMFADSSGTMDALNCKVFLLQTTCVAGAIPLGALIVTSESESVLQVAFDLWKSLLPPNAFFGRGSNVGPKLIMTDDCAAERNALQTVFPFAILLLCLFHILQAFWRYVWNRESNIPKEDRGEVFFIFRDLVYAETEEIFPERLAYARNCEKMKKYKKVLEHLETYIPRARDWALCYRKNLLTRGNDTNNYSEAGMRIFKDKVLERTKAFNPVHLAEFVTTRYDAYLKRRLIDVINNRASNVFKSRFYVRPEKIQDLTCHKVDSLSNTYLVKNISKGTEYVVVMDLEICSCAAGQSGAPCKHLSAVVQKFQLTSSLVHPLLQSCNPSMKKILFEVVHGHQNVPNDWFADLMQKENSEVDLAQNVNPQDACSSSLSPETECESTGNDDRNAGGNPTQKHISDEDLKSLDDSLDTIFSKYKQSIREDPQFIDAIKVFISQNEKLNHSESGLLSALHTFGKTGGGLPLGFAKKRSGSAIPVQPGSKARRTVYLGGRKTQFTGRPPKAMASAPNTQDHSYGNPGKKTLQNPTPVWHNLPTRVFPAPHTLLECVTNNKMVGSNHARK